MKHSTFHEKAPRAHLAAIVESSGDAIISKDLNGTITSWNRGAEDMFGYTADEVIGRSVTILMPPDRVNEEPGILERIRRGEAINHYETIRRHKDGRLLDISLNVSPIFNESGDVIGASKIARDISERRRNEAEMAKLAAIVESSSDAIISKDLNGTIMSWNKGAETIFGYTAQEAIGQPITMLMPPERVSEEPGILERIRRGEAVDHFETIRRHKDGRLLNISLNISPIRDAHGVIVGASKIARDITKQKQAENALKELETMHRIVEAQEAERHRIARDLHDHLGQQMTALRLKIESLMERVDELHRDVVSEIREIAFQIDKDIGYLSWELRPTELDQLGLEDALRTFVNQWSLQSGVEADFYAESSTGRPHRFTGECETHIYRIVQEALNNIAKHANAKHVNILLHQQRDAAVLMIEDDGVGFSPGGRRSSSTEGLGLIGMRERASLLHGVLEIESEPGRGTTIVARIPVADNCSPARQAGRKPISKASPPLPDITAAPLESIS